MVGIIVAGVLWFFLGGAATALIFWLVATIWAATFGQKHLGFGLLIGWLLALGWEAFVIIQVIIQVVNLIKELS